REGGTWWGWEGNHVGRGEKRRSTAAAIRNNLRSWPLRATNISPTGRAPARGNGNASLAAGGASTSTLDPARVASPATSNRSLMLTIVPSVRDDIAMQLAISLAGIVLMVAIGGLLTWYKEG